MRTKTLCVLLTLVVGGGFGVWHYLPKAKPQLSEYRVTNPKNLEYYHTFMVRTEQYKLALPDKSKLFAVTDQEYSAYKQGKPSVNRALYAALTVERCQEVLRLLTRHPLQGQALLQSFAKGPDSVTVQTEILAVYRKLYTGIAPQRLSSTVPAAKKSTYVPKNEKQALAEIKQKEAAAKKLEEERQHCQLYLDSMGLSIPEGFDKKPWDKLQAEIRKQTATLLQDTKWPENVIATFSRG